MEKKLNRAYLVFSLCFFLGLCLWGILGINRIRNRNIEDGHSTFNRVKDTILASYLVDNRFDSPYFKGALETLFNREPSLRALLIYSSTNGIEYFFTHDSSYFLMPIEECLAMRKKPEYNIEGFSELLLSSSLLIPTAPSGFEVDLIYQTFSRSHIILILKQILLALIGFQILTALLLLVLQLTSGKGKAAQNKQEDISLGTEIASVPDILLQKEDLKTTYLDKPSERELKEEIEAEDKVNLSKEGGRTTGGLFSERSGLGWEAYLEERLNAELARAASFDQDLTCAVFGSSAPCQEEDYRIVGKKIIEFFKFQDLAFELGDSCFIVILPNLDLDSGILKAEEFLRILDESSVHYDFKAGLSSRNGRLLRANLILKETKRSLEKALEDKENRIIAFRTDPVKFRHFIATKD